MASRNCSGQFNNSENQKVCGININDQVPLSPMEKIAAFSVVYGVLFLVSVVGNALVCIVIIKRKDMRTVTNFFLLNMALSDILSTLFGIPAVLAAEISPHYWPLGDFMCPAFRVISTISVSASIYSMVALALERYQAIVNPFTVRASRHSYKRTTILILAIWLVSCGIAAPQAWIATSEDIPPYKYCFEDWTRHGGEMGNRVYTVVAFVVLFAIPIVVICISYAIIMQNLWQPEHVLTNQQARVTDNDEQVSRKFRLTVHGAKKKRKTTYMLLTVIVVFLICMLPFQILILITAFIDISPSDAFDVIIKMSSVLAVCSMACNPFIYSFFSEKFRRAFLDVFKCRCQDDSQLANTQSSIIFLSSTILRK